MLNKTIKLTTTAVILATLIMLTACTQEQQNRVSRSIQNWTGTDGVLELYAGEKLVRRFLHIDKLTTATATESANSRSYRYGFGVLDANLNMLADADEKKVYFEISDFSNYVFFENPAN